jgi:hypothetical protein
MAEAGNIDPGDTREISSGFGGCRDIVREDAVFFFFPGSVPPVSNWILRRFGLLIRGRLDSDAAALVQMAPWNPDAAPKAEVMLPSYAAFDFGRGVTVTVDRQSVGIEQEIGSGAAATPTTAKDRLLPLAEQLITLVGLRSVRTFVTELRMIVPHPHPYDMLIERYLQRFAASKAGHRLNTVRLTLGYPIDDGEFKVTLAPHGPTPAWNAPHLSVRAEFSFGPLARKRLIELFARADDYDEQAQAILVALLA